MARTRAAEKNLPFDLDLHREKIRDRVDALVCEMTGIKLDPVAKKAWNSPSIDRVEPAKGYIYANIRIVAFGMNCALGTWGDAPLRGLMKAWFENGASDASGN